MLLLAEVRGDAVLPCANLEFAVPEKVMWKDPE